MTASTRVIHNSTEEAFSEAVLVRRIPARQPSREPYRPCTVAIPDHQGGRR